MIYYKDDFYEMIKGYGDKFSEQKYTLLTPGEKGNEFRSAIKRIANKVASGDISLDFYGSNYSEFFKERYTISNIENEIGKINRLYADYGFGFEEMYIGHHLSGKHHVDLKQYISEHIVDEKRLKEFFAPKGNATTNKKQQKVNANETKSENYKKAPKNDIKDIEDVTNTNFSKTNAEVNKPLNAKQTVESNNVITTNLEKEAKKFKDIVGTSNFKGKFEDVWREYNEVNKALAAAGGTQDVITFGSFVRQKMEEQLGGSQKTINTGFDKREPLNVWNLKEELVYDAIHGEGAYKRKRIEKQKGTRTKVAALHTEDYRPIDFTISTEDYRPIDFTLGKETNKTGGTAHQESVNDAKNDGGVKANKTSASEGKQQPPPPTEEKTTKPPPGGSEPGPEPPPAEGKATKKEKPPQPGTSPHEFLDYKGYAKGKGEMYDRYSKYLSMNFGENTWKVLPQDELAAVNASAKKASNRLANFANPFAATPMQNIKLRTGFFKWRSAAETYRNYILPENWPKKGYEKIGLLEHEKYTLDKGVLRGSVSSNNMLYGFEINPPEKKSTLRVGKEGWAWTAETAKKIRANHPYTPIGVGELRYSFHEAATGKLITDKTRINKYLDVMNMQWEVGEGKRFASFDAAERHINEALGWSKVREVTPKGEVREVWRPGEKGVIVKQHLPGAKAIKANEAVTNIKDIPARATWREVYTTTGESALWRSSKRFLRRNAGALIGWGLTIGGAYLGIKLLSNLSSHPTNEDRYRGAAYAY